MSTPIHTKQRARGLVTLVNPNFVHPPITPYALDILATALEREGFEVEVVDLTFERDHWQEKIRGYFETRAPLLVGVSVRNTDTIYPQEQKVFLDAHRRVITEIRRATGAPIVAGGVGFSSMPFALVNYFSIPYGVKGPGEVIVCELALCLSEGRPPEQVDGLIVNDGREVRMVNSPYTDNGFSAMLRLPSRSARSRIAAVNRSAPYVRRAGTEFKVDNLAYYERGGLGNILTKNGCAFACAHCVEPDAKGTRFARRSVPSVVDEMEALVRLGVFDLHTTDSEFNLSLGNSKAVLREIIRRKALDIDSPLHELRLWIYCQPAPFDEEFAVLLALAGCRGINVSPDHVREDMLNSWKVTENGKRYYTFEAVEKICALASQNGMLTMVEVLLGMPGETEDTLKEAIDRTLALDATVVGYTLGIRIFPYSPLGIRFSEQSRGESVVPGLQSNTARTPILLKPLGDCESIVEYERQFMFDEEGRVRPVFYFSPELPEDWDTVAKSSGRWLRTLQLMWDHVPPEDHDRVMLPTVPGVSEHDNNYADNPFLLALTAQGYKGAYWARWRSRKEIMAKARILAAV